MVSTQLRGKIVPTGQNMVWIDARNAVKDKGGLPSSVLHDQHLVGSERYAELPRNYYPAWAREVLVYPAKNGVFVEGEHVTDAETDSKNMQWKVDKEFLVLAHTIKQVFGLTGVSLFIDPGADPANVYEKDGSIWVRPDRGVDSIVVLHNSIQISGNCGKMDEATGIPLEVPKELLDKLTEDQKRWLYKINGAGVRPLSRIVYRDGDDRRDVDAVTGRNGGLGVAYVETSEAREGGEAVSREVELVRPAETTGPAYRSAPAEVRSPVISLSGSVYDAALAEYKRLGEILQPHQLVAYRKLLDSLAIKQ